MNAAVVPVFDAEVVVASRPPAGFVVDPTATDPTDATSSAATERDLPSDRRRNQQADARRRPLPHRRLERLRHSSPRHGTCGSATSDCAWAGSTGPWAGARMTAVALSMAPHLHCGPWATASPSCGELAAADKQPQQLLGALGDKGIGCLASRWNVGAGAKAGAAEEL